jgi:hypothetical protein
MGHMANWSDEKRRRVAAELRTEARKSSLGGLMEGNVATFATCKRCRRIVPLDLRRLIESCGPGRDIAVVELLLRCGSCGHKGALIGLVWPEAGKPHLRAVA